MIKFIASIGFNPSQAKIPVFSRTLRLEWDNLIGRLRGVMQQGRSRLFFMTPLQLCWGWVCEFIFCEHLRFELRGQPIWKKECFPRGKIIWPLTRVFHFSFSLLTIYLSGCTSTKYLFQAGRGQFSLLSHAKPIEEVLKDEKTPVRIRALLGEVKKIKKYGEVRGLKPTHNYSDYVKLNRTSAVWVVSACEALRFRAKSWDFPIVGSFPYLGWFDYEDAKSYAEELRQEGWDVDVRGAAAYSTLGWFRDSILSTMVAPGDEALGHLANVVIHESVHATLYVNGQSFFNESLASFVADHLTETYLDQNFGPDSVEKKAYMDSEAKGLQIEKRFHQAYQQLDRIYSSQDSDEEKINKKKEILASLKEEFPFKRDINNATLIQYKTYHASTLDFEKLLSSCKGDWIRFFRTLSELKSEKFPKPQMEDFGNLLGTCEG